MGIGNAIDKRYLKIKRMSTPRSLVDIVMEYNMNAYDVLKMESQLESILVQLTPVFCKLCEDKCKLETKVKCKHIFNDLIIYPRTVRQSGFNMT